MVRKHKANALRTVQGISYYKRLCLGSMGRILFVKAATFRALHLVFVLAVVHHSLVSLGSVREQSIRR